MLIIYLAIFAISSFILIRSGALVVRVLARISLFLAISEFVVSFILMAFVTSLPEIFVSIGAAISDNSVLAFGNNVGSNILYPTLLIGLVAILGRKLYLKGEIFQRDNIYSSIIAILPFLFMIDLKLSRLEGFILVAVFFIYLIRILKQRKVFSKIYQNSIVADLEHFRGFLKEVLLFIAGIIFLMLSSWGIVTSAVQIAEILNFPLILIGIFLVAIGVALPELVFSVKAVIQGHKDMIMGNMFGSLVVNSGFALGIAAIISPVVISNRSFFYVSAGFGVLSLLLFGYLARTREALSWREGMILIFLYFIFVVLEFMIK